MSIGGYINIFNEWSFPRISERPCYCDYDNCILKSLIELNPSIEGNEACRVNYSRQGTKVIKDNRYAHARGTEVKYRDKCGINVDKFLTGMPRSIRKLL